MYLNRMTVVYKTKLKNIHKFMKCLKYSSCIVRLHNRPHLSYFKYSPITHFVLDGNLMLRTPRYPVNAVYVHP